jgi:hypothetical protein
VKDIIKLEFVIISISTIITICAYSSISANSSQLAPTIKNLVPNFWTCKNGTVGTSLAPLAGRWHVFFLLDVRDKSLKIKCSYVSLKHITSYLS